MSFAFDIIVFWFLATALCLPFGIYIFVRGSVPAIAPAVQAAAIAIAQIVVFEFGVWTFVWAAVFYAHMHFTMNYTQRLLDFYTATRQASRV